MELTGWDRETSPYHAGEQELHDRLGRKEHQERMARNIHRPYMPKQHQEFFAQLPFLVAGSVDQEGWPWASILFGKPGFIEAPNDRSFSIGGGKISGDPFWENAVAGAPLGFVGIELATRRRNRLNGVARAADGSLLIDVVQSFGNCPQYIHSRDTDFIRDPQQPFDAEVNKFTEFDSTTIDLIRGAGTLFVASHNDRDDKFDSGGVDANHRGGKPGFVKVEGNTLTIPEYIGNFAFNTLGNFLVNPKAGLLFIDFATGDLVQLTGTVELIWDSTEEIEAFRGAERAWRFHLDHGHTLKSGAPLRWQEAEASPNVKLTGDWTEASKTLEAQANQNAWQLFRVAQVEDESSVIRSFYFEPLDGGTILPFKPGQFLTLKVLPEGAKEPVTRTYTVSSAPSDPHYRISVKRDGIVSQHLHNQVEVGDTVELRAPQGAFWMDTDEKRPAVLLAGGVGITPMISMARQAATDGFARRHLRPLTVFHSAQTTDQRAFAKEFATLQSASQGRLRYISLIEQPAEHEEVGQEFDVNGRISSDLLQSVLPLADYDFFLCGPPPFMQAVYDMLIGLGVNDSRIQAEAFGPASLIRQALPIGAKELQLELEPFDADDEAVVTFAGSKVEQPWVSADGTLLEFAEAHGLTPNFGCRGGSCGSCATKILSGNVGYTTKPSFEPNEGEILLCCSVPAKSKEPLSIDI